MNEDKSSEPKWMQQATENSREAIKRGHLGGILIVEQEAAFDAESNYRRPPKGWTPENSIPYKTDPAKFQKSWLSPEGNLTPLPHESLENSKQKPFECGWVHLVFQGADIIVVEYEKEIGLSKLQLSRLIELAAGAGAKHLMADRGGKMECIWSRDTTSPLG